MYREDAHEDRSLLIVAHAGGVVALQRETGQVAWRQEMTEPFLKRQLPRSGVADLAIVGGRVFIATHERVTCLDYKTGTILGDYPLNSYGRCSLLVDGDLFYVVTAQHVLCLNLGGQLLWQTPHDHLLHGYSATMGFPGNVRPGDQVRE